MPMVRRLYTRSTILFFFFQAEDGIRDRNVTGVQTCALPIYADHAVSHIKMSFTKDSKSQVEAELSTLVDRSELSDIQSESIAGLFSQIIREIKASFNGLPLDKIIFEADLNLLGLDNDTMKITLRFTPKT